MIITLPKPPSVNHIYGLSSRSGKAISYITKKGKNWFEEAGWLLKSQWRKKTITGNVGIYITLYCIRQDIDGILKPVLDLLQKMRVYENDNQVDFLQIKKVKVSHKKDEKIELEIQF